MLPIVLNNLFLQLLSANTLIQLKRHTIVICLHVSWGDLRLRGSALIQAMVHLCLGLLLVWHISVIYLHLESFIFRFPDFIFLVRGTLVFLVNGFFWIIFTILLLFKIRRWWILLGQLASSRFLPAQRCLRPNLGETSRIVFELSRDWFIFVLLFLLIDIMVNPRAQLLFIHVLQLFQLLSESLFVSFIDIYIDIDVTMIYQDCLILATLILIIIGWKGKGVW